MQCFKIIFLKYLLFTWKCHAKHHTTIEHKLHSIQNNEDNQHIRNLIDPLKMFKCTKGANTKHILPCVTLKVQYTNISYIMMSLKNSATLSPKST